MYTPTHLLLVSRQEITYYYRRCTAVLQVIYLYTVMP